ncbi:TIGR02266 family protein [bacterium]|nr:TIGR02266 family protein [bacterium]
MSEKNKPKEVTQVVDVTGRSADDVVLHNDRVAQRVSIELEVTTQGQHNFFHGMTEDVSQGGLFVATTQLYPIGTNVEIVLRLDGSALQIKAEVVWVRDIPQSEGDTPRGMGLHFSNIEDGDLQKIRQFLHKKEPLFFEMDE